MIVAALLLAALGTFGFVFTQRLTAEQAARNEWYRRARAAAIAEQERQDRVHARLAGQAAEEAAEDAEVEDEVDVEPIEAVVVDG